MSMFKKGKHASPNSPDGAGIPRKRFRTRAMAVYGAGVLIGAVVSIVGIAGATSANASPPPATSPLYYSGQGIPVQQQCDQSNNAYLLFVFTGGSATNVKLHGITVTDTKVTNGSVHFTTVYVDPPSSLIGKVYATWGGDAGKNPQLVISHGCSGTNGGGSSSSPPPGCVTLSSSNVSQYGSLVWTGNSATVTLKQRDGGYCNDWTFDVTRYQPAAFPQTVQQVSSASVGKSGLSATAKVDDTTCGQIDGYEGSGPQVGSTLSGPGKDYESNHKFLSQVFGPPNTWTINNSGCNTSTPPSQPQGSGTATLVCSSLQGGEYYQVKIEGSWSGLKPDTQYVVDLNGSGGAVANTPLIETDSQGNLTVSGTFDEELAQKGFGPGQATLFIVEQGQNTPAFSEQVDIPAPDCAPASSSAPPSSSTPPSSSVAPPTSGSPSTSHSQSTTTCRSGYMLENGSCVKKTTQGPTLGVGTGVSATPAQPVGAATSLSAPAPSKTVWDLLIVMGAAFAGLCGVGMFRALASRR